MYYTFATYKAPKTPQRALLCTTHLHFLLHIALFTTHIVYTFTMYKGTTEEH